MHFVQKTYPHYTYFYSFERLCLRLKSKIIHPLPNELILDNRYKFNIWSET